MPAATTNAVCILNFLYTLATDMDTLRTLNRLRWSVVAWFVLSLGVTLASPLVQPRSMELVCSGASGSTLVMHAKTGNAVLDALDKDCALCLLGSAPILPAPQIQPPLAADHAPPAPPPQVHAIVPMAAPPPARGPPHHPVCHT